MCFVMVAAIGCKEDEGLNGGAIIDDTEEEDKEEEEDRLAKRQMHFTFVQFQNTAVDSLVDGATIKLYKNYTDFDADSAVAANGTSKLGKLILAGEDDGAAYYYRANHTDYNEVTGSAVNSLFDDYFTVEFE